MQIPPKVAIIENYDENVDEVNVQNETKIIKIKELKNVYFTLKEQTEEIMRYKKMQEEKSHNLYENIDYKNIKRDRYTVQSITSIEDNILISAYKKNNFSRLYIYNRKTAKYEGKIILDIKSHVGGISYDKNNGILYVTASNGEVKTYDYKVIEKLDILPYDYTIDFSDTVKFLAEMNLEIKNEINVKNINKKAKTSTIYFYDNKIYVGTFNPVNHGFLYCYKVKYDEQNKSIRIEEKPHEYQIGARVQGIAITEFNHKKYLVCTQSIGFTKSVFLLYTIESNQLNFEGRYYLDEPGLEGITIDEHGEIVGVFEHNDRNPIVINISELINLVSDSILDYIPGNGLAALIGGKIYQLTHR